MADTPRVGDLAPDFSLTDTKGNVHRLLDYRGDKSVALIFNRGFT